MSHTAPTSHRPGIARRVAIAGLFLLPAACGGGADDQAESGATTLAPSADAGDTSYGLVTPDQAASLAADPEIAVIDVRTPEEFADGHIDGAVMIDFYADSFGDEIAALDPDATYLLYCRSGNRSGQTAALMAELGFDRVYDLEGGVIAWDAAGGALVR